MNQLMPDMYISIPTKTCWDILLCWDKIDKEAYNNTDNQLKALSSHLYGMSLTIIADRLNQILRSCAEWFSPPIIKKMRRKGKKSFKPLADFSVVVRWQSG